MKSTQVLKEEHGGIKIMLGILGTACDRLESGQAVPGTDLERILEFLKVFVDRCHHAKEEDFLFPALERTGIPREGGPIGVMLSEHVKGREFIRGMSDTAEGCSKGERAAVEKFTFYARGYTELLLEHIEKEDEILYPMADGRLDDAVDRTLMEEFERVEEERVGHGKHEEFHRLMEELQKSYRG
jgi:hemerythrin-like domain-containing protein